MSRWYIDRSRNISSIVSSIHYNLLKDVIDSPLFLNRSIDSQVLINQLKIDGANKNALLTNFRDLGLINTTDNKPSSFFITCSKARLSLETIVLLILLKRNDEKNASNSIKPFVIMAKALSMMRDNGIIPALSWEICSNYLMCINNYNDLVWSKMSHELEFPKECASTPVLDIWFNALIATGLFNGNNHKIILKRDYYNFIDFVAKYGPEMVPSLTRTEYVSQACDSKYGWYNLFKNHTYEAVCCVANLPELITFIQTEDYLTKNESQNAYEIVDESSKSISKLKKDLIVLKQEEVEIQKKICYIEECLSVAKEKENFKTIETDPTYKELYSYYLKENKGLSNRTVYNYYQSLEKARECLNQYVGILLNTELYYIKDIEVFKKIISIFEKNKNLIEINRTLHNSISAAYNNYLDFLKTIKDLELN